MSQERALSDARAWLFSQQSAMTSDLMELANLNSGSANLHGLLRVCDWLEGWMNITSCPCQRLNLPDRTVVDDRGTELSIQAAPALRWDCRLESSRLVLLGIHYDTVYPPNHPLQKCYWLSPERLGGPGVADAKGGIVILRYALQAMEKFSLGDECGWTIVLNPDEEIGSPSSAPLLQAMAPDYDFGLWFEPTLPGGSLVSERKGSGIFSVVVHGRAAHAGRQFHLGRNAITHLSRFIEMLDRLNGQRAGVTLNVGHFVGGGPVNVVPDLAIARFNVRVEDDDQQAWVENSVRSLLDEFNRSEGLSCQIHGGFHAPPKRINAPQRQLMQAIEISAVRLGGSVEWQVSGGACDGNKLTSAGLPNVDSMGVIGDGLHSNHEWTLVDSLPRKAMVVVDLLSRYSAGQFRISA